ncbi:hypothetical protein [Agromyces sp. H66]|uniref:hypothetical protein n=1 Tax=Agromyces sp. H66 TaxID=2529859 RepID=UPI0010AA7594|nr:hypothetical protein [Agromyces sp. H66]
MTVTDAAGPQLGIRMLRRWPTAFGLVFGASLVVAYWFGFADTERMSQVLIAAGLVYLGSAALRLRTAAWPVFAATVVLITTGFLVPSFDPFWWMLGIAGLLVVVGLVRGALRPPWGMPLAFGAMALIVVVALAASRLDGPWAALLVAGGLLAHAVWDVVHHRTGRVVVRSMAEFCAVLDTLLAFGIVAVTFLG